MASAPGSDGGSEIENLKPREENAPEVKTVDTKANRKPIAEAERPKRHSAYRPSHKATFIGLAVVIVILGINALVLAFLLKSENAKNKSVNDKGVSISPGVLSKLGVNDAQIGNSNEQLVVDPSAQFNSNVQVAGSLNISGQLHLNSTFSASNASLAQLSAGNTSVNALTINGNETTNDLSVKGNFGVSGASVFQNTVKIGQILTVANSADIANNLSVGGEITANTVATSNLILTGTIVFGSHIQTSGISPSIGPGPALGSYGTTTISGDDAAGTITINIGTGAPSGVLAYVAFHSAYTARPRIVITPVGIGADFYIINPTTSGFEVAVASGLPIGGYEIDYIAEQ